MELTLLRQLPRAFLEANQSSFQELNEGITVLLRELRAATLLEPCDSQRLGVVLDEVLALIMNTDAHLTDCLHEDTLDALDHHGLVEGQEWLQELHKFIMALQHDMHECKEVAADGVPGANDYWTQLVQAAITKLQHALPQHHGYPGRQRHPFHSYSQQHGGGDDSSASSQYEAGGEGAPALSSYASSTKSMGHRLVATRARMQYSTHWACKIGV